MGQALIGSDDLDEAIQLCARRAHRTIIGYIETAGRHFPMGGKGRLIVLDRLEEKFRTSRGAVDFEPQAIAAVVLEIIEVDGIEPTGERDRFSCGVKAAAPFVAGNHFAADFQKEAIVRSDGDPVISGFQPDEPLDAHADGRHRSVAAAAL